MSEILLQSQTLQIEEILLQSRGQDCSKISSEPVVNLGDEKKTVVFVSSLNWSFFFVPKDLGDEKN